MPAHKWMTGFGNGITHALLKFYTWIYFGKMIDHPHIIRMTNGIVKAFFIHPNLLHGGKGMFFLCIFRLHTKSIAPPCIIDTI